MDLLAFLRLLSGSELLSLFCRVWGWARPAQHPTVSGLHAGSAPSSAFASGSLYVSAEHASDAASSPKAYKNVPGATSSPTDYKNADSKNAVAKNRDATSSSLTDTKNRGEIVDAAASSLADPKNRAKVADAAASSLADPKNAIAKNRDAAASSLADPKNAVAKVADATNPKNRGMIADASSSLAANLRPTFRAFVAARATARASRSGSTTAVLFNAHCPFCDWSGRVSISVLGTHADECRHRRYAMELRLSEARAAKKAKAAAQRRRFKR